MDLENLVRSVPNWETLSAAAIADALNLATERSDERVWTVQGLRDTLGDQDAGAVLYAIENTTNPIIKTAHITLAVIGLTLHTSDRQQLIDALAAEFAWPAELAAAVKALGRPMRSDYANAGGVGDVSAADVQTALEAIAAADAAAALEARIVNACALASERIPNAADAAATWAACWGDAV